MYNSTLHNPNVLDIHVFHDVNLHFMAMCEYYHHDSTG